MSRSLGWTLLTTFSPIEIVPEVMFSSPASMRSRVDLPQPDGPTSTTNSPSSIGIDTPCSTSKFPNDFRTSQICTDDIHSPPNSSNLPRDRCRGLAFVGLRLIRLFHGSYQTFCTLSSDQSRKTRLLPPRLRSNQWHVKSGETGAQY